MDDPANTGWLRLPKTLDFQTGYAPDGNVSGLVGGYLGIGFDEYCNFSEPAQARGGGSGTTSNSIVLRGSTTTNTAITNKYLPFKTIAATIDLIGYNTPVYNRPTGSELLSNLE